MPFIEQLGQAAAGQASGNFINEGMGLLFQGAKNKQARKQARKMQEIALEGHYKATDYNTIKQKELWEATSYPAQVEMLKKAGLNPGLAYGMGGGGGVTANIATAGGDTPTAPVAQPSHGSEGMGMMIGQLGLLKAQQEVLESQADLNKANADKTRGVDTDEAKTRISNILANTENTQVKTAGEKLENTLKEIEVKFQSNELNYEAREDLLIAAAAQAKELVDQMSIKTGTDRMLQQTVINTARQELANLKVQNLLMRAQQTNINENTKKIIQDVLNDKQRLSMMASQLALAWQAYEDGGYNRIREANEALRDDTWDFLKDLTPGFLIPIGKGFGNSGSKPVRGFHNR